MAGAPPVRGIAFDLFHSLVDPEEFRPREFRRARVVAELLGLEVDPFVRFWEAGSPARQIARVPTVVDRVRAYAAAQRRNPPASVWAEVDEALGRYQDLAIRRPRASTLATLASLRRRGWTLGLVSNCDEREIRAWAGAELARRFDGVVLSCEVGVAKPDAGAFQALVPRWGGVPLDAAVYVGDGFGGELAGARRAGFARVLFQSEFVATNGLRSGAENDRARSEADGEIDRLARLLELPAPGPAGRGA